MVESMNNLGKVYCPRDCQSEFEQPQGSSILQRCHLRVMPALNGPQNGGSFKIENHLYNSLDGVNDMSGYL